ncbi:C-3 sterol dehydrogenase/C-4 decarboxylase-like protein [Massarina eburnea CBS 473.64]|uniref:C-3 sterol dehydrogenase/C-4 decarboxylase-like protein n=1 Tax=Massarina eburnea CBS 473.64 TaxID=1395130 RepID=A0A6A6SAJ9_9PLEO|nr:C-3 sterol dehydrogenase/C-4 decarboxylase-like protein [Massarina eburnea CBS 473.64]
MAPIKVLVTGGTGFVGTAIIKAFLSLPNPSQYAITALDINPPSPGTQSFSQVRYVRGNVLQREDLKKVFEEARPHVVVHTVGVYHTGPERYSLKGKGWETVFEVNVEGTRNVVDMSKEAGVRALVYTSSVTVLLDELDEDFRNADETWPTGRATTSYGRSKAIAEDLVLAANKPDFATCSLRPCVIFGPNDPATIPIIHGCIIKGETPFILGDNNNLQDYVYVGNVADAHVLAVRNLLNSCTAAGEAFFITNGEPVSARDICISIWKEFDHVPPFQITIPSGLAWWMGLGSEWWSWVSGTQGTFSRGVILDATKDRYVSISKAKRVLGYVPRVSLPDAFRISCQYFKQKFKDQERK